MIVAKGIQPKEWNQDLLKLEPKSTIEELVEYVVRKRQVGRKDSADLVKALRE